ncbi:MAG: response regulator [Planctomycetota bacterium]
MQSTDKHAIETLRVSDRDRSRLIDQVESASSKTVQDDRRRLRVSFTQSKAVLSVYTETGAATRFVVMTRNLSRMGVAIVHGRFIFPETKCEVMLQSLDHQWVPVPGVVRSCRHVQGMVHEVAVVFDQAIHLPSFVALSPEQEMLNLEDVTRDMAPEEAAKVQRMVGRVLVIDAYPVDRKLFTLWLGQSGFKAESAGHSIQAFGMAAKERFDLFLVEMFLGNENGADLITDLRAQMPDVPMLAMSADENEAVKQQAIDAGANDFIVKPFTKEQLIDQCQTIVGVDLNDESDLVPIYSNNTDEDLKPLLAEFVLGLSNYISRLREASARNDTNTLKSMARTLKGAGAGYGLQPITDQAGELGQLLEDEQIPLEEMRKSVNELVKILNRVRL